jgi:hypothetical protein
MRPPDRQKPGRVIKVIQPTEDRYQSGMPRM